MNDKEVLNALLITGSNDTRYALAQEGYGLKSLVKDSVTFIREEAERHLKRTRGGSEIVRSPDTVIVNRLAAHSNPSIRQEIAQKKCRLDMLINDPSELVRATVAKTGYKPTKLVNDESSIVRMSLANQGYCLNALVHDFDPDVYFAARNQINLKGMSWSDALNRLKEGFLVARKGWNGKNMFLYYVESTTFTVDREPLLSIFKAGTKIAYRDHIDMKTATKDHIECVPWVCSQTDALADDWVFVDEENNND